MENLENDIGHMDINAMDEEEKRPVLQNILHNAQECAVLQLPDEVLQYLLKWVISDHLDMASLRSWSLVCKDFYHLSQDPTLWKAICQRVWGEGVGMESYGSWQSLYLSKPHVFSHGVYISRTSYMRAGDASMSLHYRPYHMVEYFRMLRFFPTGDVMMLTTPQDPREAVYKLSWKNKKNQGLLKGKYFVHEEKTTECSSRCIVMVILKKIFVSKQSSRHNTRGRRSPSTVAKESEEYHLELELSSTSSKRKFNKLSWLHHSCHTRYVSVENVSSCNFDVSHQYPALYFNRIKAFTEEATKPLP